METKSVFLMNHRSPQLVLDIWRKSLSYIVKIQDAIDWQWLGIFSVIHPNDFYQRLSLYLQASRHLWWVGLEKQHTGSTIFLANYCSWNFWEIPKYVWLDCNSWRQLTVFTETSNLDVWQGSKYASGILLTSTSYKKFIQKWKENLI